MRMRAAKSGSRWQTTDNCGTLVGCPEFYNPACPQAPRTMPDLAKAVIEPAVADADAQVGSATEGRFISFPGSPFELFMPYLPAGDQPQAIDKLVEGVNDGEVFQTLLGVTGSGKTFTMANVIARLGRPAIIFAPNKTLAAQLYSEFREFFPRNAVEYFVS